MNVLLMSCRSPFLDNDKVYPPLGIMKLQSAIHSWTNAKVYLTDDYNLDKYCFEDYDLVGVSVMTPQREESLKILNEAKNQGKKTIIGGPHAKHYLENIIKEDWDYIVPRDGEKAIVEIINGTNKRILSDFIEKPTYAKLPKIDRLNNKEFLNHYVYNLKGRKSTTILTATGCPERCTFCEDAQTAVRWTDINILKEEMDDIKELGYGGVYIFDDLFAISRKMVDPITKELSKRDLIYRCNGQARYMNDDFMRMLSDTGCVEIAFGAETGSQKILDNIQKRTTIEMNYKFIELAKKYGIDVKAFILLGLPGENWETLKETENFIKNSQPNDFQCAVYMPYKGTKIRRAIDYGENIDIQMIYPEVSGAYGIKGGETSYDVRTNALSQEDLKTFRNYLVDKYKPKSHKNRWSFFDTHLQTEVEYGK